MLWCFTGEGKSSITVIKQTHVLTETLTVTYLPSFLFLQGHCFAAHRRWTPLEACHHSPLLYTLWALPLFVPHHELHFKNIELSNLLMRGGCNFFLFAGRGRTFFCLLTAISHVAQTPGVIYFSYIKRYIPYARCLCHVASVFERGRGGGQHLPKILIRGPWRGGGGSIPLIPLGFSFTVDIFSRSLLHYQVCHI